MAVDRTVAPGANGPAGPAPAAGTPVRPNDRAGLARRTGLADWRGDVALELWVEADAVPARVRMAGRLDATTASHLTVVVSELLADGVREIELVTDGLRVVDAPVVGVLADIERLVGQAGGTLVRLGPSIGPFPRGRRVVTPPTARG